MKLKNRIINKIEYLIAQFQSDRVKKELYFFQCLQFPQTLLRINRSNKHKKNKITKLQL